MNPKIADEKVALYESFFENEVPKALKQLSPKTAALWGKMKVQDMIEHLEIAVLASTILQTPPAQLPNDRQKQARGLIYTDVVMARNLYNPTLQYGLPPLKHPNLEVAIEKLLDKIALFFHSFKRKPENHSLNMFLGDLNYAENLAFHYKHFKHHFTQFAVIEDDTMKE